MSDRSLLLPQGAARFKPEESSPAALEEVLQETMTRLRQRAGDDVFSNPIMLFALDLTRRIDRGEVSYSALEQLVQHLSMEAFEDRAARLGSYLGETSPDENDDAVEALINGIKPGADFATFRVMVERVHFGIVLTAHPTFAMTIEQSRNLVDLATGYTQHDRPLDEAGRQKILDSAARVEHRPPAELTLSLEYEWSVEALKNAHDALERVHRTVLRVTRERFPEQWTELTPRMVTLASWVGYDQDGRTDITWGQTFGKRLQVKHSLLQRYRDQAALMIIGADSTLMPIMQRLAGMLDLAILTVEEQLEALHRADADPAETAAFARLVIAGRDAALVTTTGLRELINEALALKPDEVLAEDLLVMRASLVTHGLALGHTHVRLNSTQLHTAIRKQIGLTTSPSDPANRRSYFNAINDLLGRVTPVSINFASLMTESSTARKLAMTVAQILKLIDGEMPVRFLIAETETGFTLLTALYYAKLFGIADRIDISPLFETAEAFDRGAQVIEEALRSPHYVEYLRTRRRMAIQFGFSDSGRFMGQMAATFRIERLRLSLAQLLLKAGLGDLQLVLFNTHGESIGRGGHPISLADRLAYVAPPFSRAEIARAGIRVKEEVSFQGGDGYLPFLSHAAALASVRNILEFVLAPNEEAVNDPIYSANDYAAEFFATVQQEFGALVEDPDYAALLGFIGTNLLYRSGSRPAKRQTEGWGQTLRLGHPSQLRAIPNNAVLQQIGMLANTVYGLGRAAEKDPEFFATLRARSPRFRRALQMVEEAVNASDLDVLRAYVDTLDPGMWLTRSGRTRSPSRAKALKILAAQCESIDLHDSLARVLRRLQADYLRLLELLPPASSARRDRLILLHGIRIAIIHRLCLLATTIPDFSPVHGTSREAMIQRVLQLEVVTVTDKLATIFPRQEQQAGVRGDFGEPATYRAEAAMSYEYEHDNLFNPLFGLYDLTRRIGTSISYLIGAMG
jgi:phosphoenolpyruvate carboxylase